MLLYAVVADQLNITPDQKAKFLVVGGETISTYVTKLNYLKVGPFKKKTSMPAPSTTVDLPSFIRAF